MNKKEEEENENTTERNADAEIKKNKKSRRVCKQAEKKKIMFKYDNRKEEDQWRRKEKEKIRRNKDDYNKDKADLNRIISGCERRLIRWEDNNSSMIHEDKCIERNHKSK